MGCGARRQLCEVRQHRGRRLRGARAAHVFHVKHDVYRVAGGRRRRRYLVLKGGGRKGLSTKTDKSSLPYKTPWNFYREGMILPVFVCACLILPAGQLACLSACQLACNQTAASSSRRRCFTASGAQEISIALAARVRRKSSSTPSWSATRWKLSPM